MSELNAIQQRLIDCKPRYIQPKAEEGRKQVVVDIKYLFSEIQSLQAELEAQRQATAKTFKTQHQQAQARIDEIENKYTDLIMCVVSKYPDESRHETAKKYISNAERKESN